MANAALNGTKPALGSDWGGLSDRLIATFFAVEKGPMTDDKQTILWQRDMKQVEVRAPLTDGNMDTTLNWQSPFENVGPDQKFSSLSAMLQAGGFASILSQLQKAMPGLGVLDNAAKQAATLEGRSNITKLNSRRFSAAWRRSRSA